MLHQPLRFLSPLPASICQNSTATFKPPNSPHASAIGCQSTTLIGFRVAGVIFMALRATVLPNWPGSLQKRKFWLCGCAVHTATGKLQHGEVSEWVAFVSIIISASFKNPITLEWFIWTQKQQLWGSSFIVYQHCSSSGRATGDLAVRLYVCQKY